MAGDFHASSGVATVDHQMGHSATQSARPVTGSPLFGGTDAAGAPTLFDDNCAASVVENGDDVLSSPSALRVTSGNEPRRRGRKRRGDMSDVHAVVERKRASVSFQLADDLVRTKESFLYSSLLARFRDAYDADSVGDIVEFVNNLNYEKSLPRLDPKKPDRQYLNSAENETVVAMQRSPRQLSRSSQSEVFDSLENGVSPSSSQCKQGLARGGHSSEFSTSSSQALADKAKQEAYILQRISELQKLGLWSEKRLPKVVEPQREKVHWDFVLEEVEWLANDFAQEKKWKKAAAKKCSRMVQKYFHEREQNAQKAAKAVELQKRKMCSQIAKMIKTFWSNIEKVVDYKQKTKLEAIRKQALGQHLSYIVDKTEKYSTLVAESMNKSIQPATVDSSRSQSPVHSSDDEFKPNEDSSDDEATIEAEERQGVETEHSKEIEALMRESELPIEHLLSQLPKEYLNEVARSPPKCMDDMPSDDEYVASDEADDESTLVEEENAEGEVNHKAEISELEADNNLSIEELMKKYGAAGSNDVGNSVISSNADISSGESDKEADDSHDDESIDSDDEQLEDDEDDEEEEDDENSDDEDEVENGLISLIDDSPNKIKMENGDINEENANEKIDSAAALAESLQPKGNTLSSTCVATKVPFLLRHTLREYQHIGLDWLVTMYERNLNGILADEMGLGKTIQTIALLAHLACDKEDWGPHLIVVPTSVMLNWEMEIKKWCPAFKILTYFGNPKERKLKRFGWTKPNAFHICITSYKLVLQDHHSFRRKKWKYLILDEAQNIKNFKSQRWQRLLNFDSERRLLLTGTPLQNNLMELWSLMHFLMPNLFTSHREFKEWFSNPVTGMIEGNAEYNETIIKQLHKVLRPFLLRRLKSEVEKQLPQKYEHVIMCRLSNRQRYLYEDFMSRAKTKETLSSGNLLSVINVLMQLRKVCNHPNLFEPRPIISPFQMPGIVYNAPSVVFNSFDDPLSQLNLESLNLRFINLEKELSAWCAYRLMKLKLPRKLIEEIDESPPEPPPTPRAKVNIRLKTPKDLNTIKLANNSRNNQKIQSLITKIASSKLTTANNSAANGNNVQYKLGPLYRTVIGQGEIKNMVVSKNQKSETGEIIRTVQIKDYIPKQPIVRQNMNSIKSSTPPTICITRPKQTPTIGALLKNVMMRSAIATNGGTELESTIQKSTPIVLTNATHLSTTTLTKSVSVKAGNGQTVILTKPIPMLDGTSTNAAKLSRNIIRFPSSSFQNARLNNGASGVPANIVLNNAISAGQSMSKMIAIPKPIGTLSNLSNACSTSNVITSASATSNANEHAPAADASEPPLGFLRKRHRAKGATPNLVLVAGRWRRVRKLGDSTMTEVTGACEPLSCDNSDTAWLAERRRELRKQKLSTLADVNERKSSPSIMFGCDVREALGVFDARGGGCVTAKSGWRCVSHANCVNAAYAKHVNLLYCTLTSALSNSVMSIEERMEQLSDVFARYIVYVPAVQARRTTMHVSHPRAWRASTERYMEYHMEHELRPLVRLLHPIDGRMRTGFPDGRLIQYDCGKLQTLDGLLRRLKSGQHRVLVFTQMTRMLDVLEAFLTFHGHIYLRLDGSTKIDQRQILMERFNADKRYFCFILSTRSGGIGVNLTGADTVIFYDSDWNPTMDAQAQDRCHRIGQTRDVHIYRLISEKTVEENILKKANQKKLLGDLAIEGGNFTAAYFKSTTTVRDLFDVDANQSASDRMRWLRDDDNPVDGSGVAEKNVLNAYESALAAAEDETDVAAARTAKEEAVAELAEFDEDVAVTNQAAATQDDELARADQNVLSLVEQLTPIERWALDFIETVDSEWAAEQMAAGEAEIEQQKREWELNRLKIEQADSLKRKLDGAPKDEISEEWHDDAAMTTDEDTEGEEDPPLTYASINARNQIWKSSDGCSTMPIWRPFSMSLETEYYVDRTLKYLYECSPIPEHQLPPIYVRKEKKRLKMDSVVSKADTSYETSHPPAAPQHRVRHKNREGAVPSFYMMEPPRTLFDRPSQLVAKLRQEMRLQKYRGLPRSAINAGALPNRAQPPSKVTPLPDFVPEWSAQEDHALLQAFQQGQELPLNLSVLYPGHEPNWDFISFLVNNVSRIYRSPQQCRHRFLTVILPREEGKTQSPEQVSKKQKKLKGNSALIGNARYSRHHKTSQMYMQDGNSTFTRLMNSRFDAIREISNRRSTSMRRLPTQQSPVNAAANAAHFSAHAELLADHDIDYDKPLGPAHVAARRLQRLTREKQSQIANSEQQVVRQGTVMTTNVGQQQPILYNTIQQNLRLSQQVRQQSGSSPDTSGQTSYFQSSSSVQQTLNMQQLQPQPVRQQSSPSSNLQPQPQTQKVVMQQQQRHIVLNQRLQPAQSMLPQQQQIVLQPSLAMNQKTVAFSSSNIISPHPTGTVVVSLNQNPNSSPSQQHLATPVTVRSITPRQIHVQEMIQQRQHQSTVVIPRSSIDGSTSQATPSRLISSGTVQRIIPVSQLNNVAGSSRIMVTASNQGLAAPDLQLLRQRQSILQHHSMKILQSRRAFGTSIANSATIQTTSLTTVTTASSTPVIVSATNIVSSAGSSQLAHIQRPVLKSISGARTTDPNELVAMIKRQQQHKVNLNSIASSSTGSASVFANSQSTSTSNLNAFGRSSIGVTTVRSALATGSVRPSTPATSQNLKALQQHIITHQRKPQAQKVTPIGQVMVNVTQAGQVFSQVLSKAQIQSGSGIGNNQVIGSRFIPVVSAQTAARRQTIQVMNASALRAVAAAAAASNSSTNTTSSETVTTSSIGTGPIGVRQLPRTLPGNAIRFAGQFPTQHFINQKFTQQMSAAIAVRQGSLKVQSSTAGGASSSNATVSTPSANVINVSLPSTLTLPRSNHPRLKIPPPKDKPGRF